MNHFSIGYPEFCIAERLQSVFKKQDNFSVNIPVSRQQKHYDLLLFNGNKNKCLTIQVKSSRTYIYPDIDTSKRFHYDVWLNNFSIIDNYSDYYFIFISFPSFNTQTFSPKTGFGTKILVFDKIEMAALLNNIKVTRSGKKDSFFGFGFNIGDHRIFGDRGFTKHPRPEFTNNLYEDKIGTLISDFS